MDPPSTAPIFTLPLEILYPIIQNLDPIGLISLSQTNKFFRWFISPQHTHFVHRLLALELLPEHGGIVPRFHARINKITPPTHAPEWEKNKYACSGCLKLLTHKMFDNHSILGLALRKPPPGSEEAARLTDWEPPGDQVVRWKRLQARNVSERQRLEEARRNYATATRSGGDWHDDPHNFLVDESEDYFHHDEEDDIQAEEAERVLCGRSRHKRLCLECKRSRGEYTRRTKSNVGSTETPMIVTRQIYAADGICEYFPRSMHGVPEPPRPRLMRVHHPSRNINLVTPLVVFCRHCSTWQDMLAFRLDSLRMVHWWTAWWNYDPRDPRKAVYSQFKCNHCVASDSGIEELCHDLMKLFMTLANNSLAHIQLRLILGWEKFEAEFYDTPMHNHGVLNQPKYKAARCRIFDARDDRGAASRQIQGLCDTAYGPINGGGHDKVYPLSNSAKKAAEDLSSRIHELRKFLNEVASLSDRAEVTDSWQGIWLEDYEDNEQLLWYTHHIVALVNNNPQRLVDYALHPARFRYPRPPLSDYQADILAREKQQSPEKNQARTDGRFLYRPPEHDTEDREC